MFNRNVDYDGRHTTTTKDITILYFTTWASGCNRGGVRCYPIRTNVLV